MPKRLAAIVLLLAAAGCSRDFSIPTAHPLALAPASATVAPLQGVTFTAEGGTPPYHFELERAASGGASIDAATGAYVAGPSGPAEDGVRVVDARGSVARARVAVGPRLSVTPTLAFAAPLGELAFSITGGLPPYALEVDETGSGGAPVGEAGWRVGPAGDTFDRLAVADAAGARVAVEVRVGPALALVATRAPEVAPRERLTFVATGGRPPYAFDLAEAGSAPAAGEAGAAPSVDAAGTYRAGSVGDATDVVRVTDENGAAAQVTVTVRLALAAHLETEDLHPGEPVRIHASGGRAPYAFRFAPEGRRSNGSVDAVTGVYTPGTAYGVTDRLEVEDAVGVVASVPPAAVGDVRFYTDWVHRGVLADLDGDDRDDLATLDLDNTLRTFRMRAEADAPDAALYPLLSRRPFSIGAPAALALDGRRGIVIANEAASWLMLPGADGRLGAPAALFEAAVPRADRLSYLGGVAPCVGPAGSGLCFYGWGRLEGSTLCDTLGRIELVDGLLAPGSASCLPAPAALPETGWRVAHLDDDLEPDLVWADGTELVVAHGPDFSQVDRFDMGGEILPLATFEPPMVLADLDASVVGPQDVVVLVRLPDGRTAATGLLGGTVLPPLELRAAGAPPPERLVAAPELFRRTTTARFPLETMLIAWRPGEREVTSFGLAEGARWWKQEVAARSPDAAGLQEAALGDVNGDRASDLAFFGPRSEYAGVLWGEGDGRFGVRPRVGPVSDGARLADVNADGLTDVVSQEGNRLEILRAHGGGFAWAADTTVSLETLVLPADLDGDGQDELIYARRGDGLWSLAPDAAGAWVVAERLPTPPEAEVTDVPVVRAGEWGGDAPGPDLLVYSLPGGVEALQALVRGAGGIFAVDLPALPADLSLGALQVADLGADGVGDVVIMGLDTARMASVAFLSRASLEGGSPVFSPWAPVEALDAHAFGAPVQGDTPGRAVLVERTSGDAGLVFVDAGGSVRVPLGHGAQAAAVGDLDGDGTLDAVVQDTEQHLYVHLDARAGGPAAQSLDLGGILLGLARLTAGGPLEVVVLSGADLVVLRNDGSGRLE